MLKISFSETPSEERWILPGRLTAPWFRELRARWKKEHGRNSQRACIVDLNEITFIDKSGERLLRLLVREGAQFIAPGDYTKKRSDHWSLPPSAAQEVYYANPVASFDEPIR